MPVYLFKHPDESIFREEIQKMSDPHVYIDSEGVEWERVWTAPTTSMGLQADADSHQQFVDKTKDWSVGDMWDYSAELSDKRKTKRGHDHIGESHDKKRKESINEVKKNRKSTRDK